MSLFIQRQRARLKMLLVSSGPRGTEPPVCLDDGHDSSDKITSRRANDAVKIGGTTPMSPKSHNVRTRKMPKTEVTNRYTVRRNEGAIECLCSFQDSIIIITGSTALKAAAPTLNDVRKDCRDHATARTICRTPKAAMTTWRFC